MPKPLAYLSTFPVIALRPSHNQPFPAPPPLHTRQINVTSSNTVAYSTVTYLGIHGTAVQLTYRNSTPHRPDLLPLLSSLNLVLTDLPLPAPPQASSTTPTFSSSPPTPAMPSSGSSGGSSVGVIVGCAVGGAALAVLVLAAVFFRLGRHRDVDGCDPEEVDPDLVKVLSSSMGRRVDGMSSTEEDSCRGMQVRTAGLAECVGLLPGVGAKQPYHMQAMQCCEGGAGAGVGGGAATARPRACQPAAAAACTAAARWPSTPRRPTRRAGCRLWACPLARRRRRAPPWVPGRAACAYTSTRAETSAPPRYSRPAASCSRPLP